MAHETGRTRANWGAIPQPGRPGEAGRDYRRIQPLKPPLSTGIHPQAHSASRVARALNPSPDRPPSMPTPETETQKKVRWPTSMGEPTPLGAIRGPTGGQKESQKNHFGEAELSPTVTSPRPAITHNRRTIEPYVAPSSALIIPWPCVRITPGLVVFSSSAVSLLHMA
jgi:hypothetical protein